MLRAKLGSVVVYYYVGGVTTCHATCSLILREDQPFWRCCGVESELSNELTQHIWMFVEGGSDDVHTCICDRVQVGVMWLKQTVHERQYAVLACDVCLFHHFGSRKDIKGVHLDFHYHAHCSRPVR
eukprot:6457821-Amphidinium_carterae.3